MFGNMYRIANRAAVEMQRPATIAENMAGSSLPGYCGKHLVTRSFDQQLDRAMSKYERTGYGAAARTTVTDFRPGALQRTGRPLDFVVEGGGWFVVNDAAGRELLTRNGSFRLSADRVLHTHEGLQVMGRQGPIRLGDDESLRDLQVGSDGVLSVPGAGGELRAIGQLRTVMVDRPEQLQRVSGCLFEAGNPELVRDPEAGEAQVRNGFCQYSNTSAVREMTAMVQSLRTFEAAQKILKLQDSLLRRHVQGK